MAYWRHRTKTGRVVYDRPKNKFRISDVKRITVHLEKPYLVLPQGAYDELFKVDPSLIGGPQGWFEGFLQAEVPSVYMMDGSVVPGLHESPAWWGENWTARVCWAILGRRHVSIVRSEWIG